MRTGIIPLAPLEQIPEAGGPWTGYIQPLQCRDYQEKRFPPGKHHTDSFPEDAHLCKTRFGKYPSDMLKQEKWMKITYFDPLKCRILQQQLREYIFMTGK